MSTAGAFFPATRVTGVDGCRDGWIGVDLADGGSVTVRAAASLDGLLADTAAQQVVGIDMPLGLLADGWRAADREARALLGPRRNSIFAIPPAPVWRAPTYAAANQRCRDLTGNGFSAQAWGLRRKLLEAAEYRMRCPHPLCEVRPELSFRTMAGAPLEHPKYAAAGHAQRRALLAGEGSGLGTSAAQARWPPRLHAAEPTAIALVLGTSVPALSFAGTEPVNCRARPSRRRTIRQSSCPRSTMLPGRGSRNSSSRGTTSPGIVTAHPGPAGKIGGVAGQVAGAAPADRPDTQRT